MEIKDILNERKILQEEIERKKLYLDLIEKKIIAMAKDDIRKIYNIYGSIFKNEIDFKNYAKCFIEVDNVEYCDQIYIKKKEFTFTCNNIEWTIYIPYDLPTNEVTLDIEQGKHDKIFLIRREGAYTVMQELITDNIKDCLMFVKEYKGEGENEK